MHIDVEELGGYLAYLRGDWKNGVSQERAKRWMEIQGHLNTCETCQKRAQALTQVNRMEKRVIERLTPRTKWDQVVMRMADSASVFEVRMKNLFESAEIRLRESGRGNQWKAVAVRGENSQWEGNFQKDEMIMGAAAGGIYVEGEHAVTVLVFDRKEDGSPGDLIYEGDTEGLEDLDLEAGNYLLVMEEIKTE